MLTGLDLQVTVAATPVTLQKHASDYGAPSSHSPGGDFNTTLARDAFSTAGYHAGDFDMVVVRAAGLGRLGIANLGPVPEHSTAFAYVRSDLAHDDAIAVLMHELGAHAGAQTRRNARTGRSRHADR